MPALPGRVADTWVDEGSGGGGVAVHNLLTGRDAADAHPIAAITDLVNELAALIPLAQKAAVNGVATLDAGGKIPAAQIPALALSEFLGTVASEAAMLALVGQRGDWCIRTDLDPDSIFILETDDPTQAANWTNVTGPGVVSVDGNTGAITAAQLLTAILTVDGPGSGLNADLLDGLSSTDFQAASTDLTDLVARWVAASAAGPASLDFAEDTDNGANRIRVTAPALLSADRAIILPDADGTLGLAGARGCRLFRTVNSANIPTATPTVISWDGEHDDTDGFHDPGTNPTRATIPAGLGGVYDIAGFARIALNGINNAADLRLYKNGALMLLGPKFFVPVITEAWTLLVAGGLRLAVGDYLELYMDQDGTPTPVQGNAAGTSSWFAVYRVGS